MRREEGIMSQKIKDAVSDIATVYCCAGEEIGADTLRNHFRECEKIGGCFVVWSHWSEAELDMIVGN